MSDPPLTRCPWWVRWHHRRLRDADRRFMVPALKKVAATKKPGAFAAAWELFKAQPGQEHWHCACAAMEFRHNLERELERG